MDGRYNRPNRKEHREGYSRGYHSDEYYNEAEEEPPPPRSSMSSWLSRASSSKELQFGATAVLSGAAVAGAIFGYQALRRQERVEDLKNSIPELGKSHATKVVDSSKIHRAVLSAPAS